MGYDSLGVFLKSWHGPRYRVVINVDGDVLFASRCVGSAVTYATLISDLRSSEVEHRSDICSRGFESRREYK